MYNKQTRIGIIMNRYLKLGSCACYMFKTTKKKKLKEVVWMLYNEQTRITKKWKWITSDVRKCVCSTPSPAPNLLRDGAYIVKWICHTTSH